MDHGVEKILFYIHAKIDSAEFYIRYNIKLKGYVLFCKIGEEVMFRGQSRNVNEPRLFKDIRVAVKELEEHKITKFHVLLDGGI